MKCRYPFSLATAAALVGLTCLWPAVVSAEHFDIVLQVSAGGKQAQSFMDTTPPIGGVNKRPIVVAKVSDELRVTWRIKSGFPHGVMKAVTVHFFVVHEDQIGQKPVPDPAGPAGVVDNSLVMDFAPDGVSNGFIRFKLPSAGNYLVRLQSENTHQEHGHEHFSAIDVHVD